MIYHYNQISDTARELSLVEQKKLQWAKERGKTNLYNYCIAYVIIL